MPRHLTKREVEVLCLLAYGDTLKMAAGKLNISFKTVVRHRENIVEKIREELKTPGVYLPHLIHYALARGYVKNLYTI